MRRDIFAFYRPACLRGAKKFLGRLLFLSSMISYRSLRFLATGRPLTFPSPSAASRPALAQAWPGFLRLLPGVRLFLFTLPSSPPTLRWFSPSCHFSPPRRDALFGDARSFHAFFFWIITYWFSACFRDQFTGDDARQGRATFLRLPVSAISPTISQASSAGSFAGQQGSMRPPARPPFDGLRSPCFLRLLAPHDFSIPALSFPLRFSAARLFDIISQQPFSPSPSYFSPPLSRQ